MPTLSGPIEQPEEVAEMNAGDSMTREEFHRIYEKMPENFKAELIGGMVYVPSPLKRRHGTHHLRLGMVFDTYVGNTPSLEAGDNTTILLGEESEPQPDLYLRILEEYGGRSRATPDDYVAGAPELLAEIALSSRSIDLHAKRLDYARYGVLEYVVASLRECELRWFDLRADQELQLDKDGVCRIRTFPGLWIHAEALFANDFHRLMAVLEEGLATPEHVTFVRKLQTAKQ